MRARLGTGQMARHVRTNILYTDATLPCTHRGTRVRTYVHVMVKWHAQLATKVRTQSILVPAGLVAVTNYHGTL
jgi:hypothetical protein